MYVTGTIYIYMLRQTSVLGIFPGVSEGTITTASDAAEAGALQEMCLGKVYGLGFRALETDLEGSYKGFTVHPKAQNSPKALQSMVIGPNLEPYIG